MKIWNAITFELLVELFIKHVIMLVENGKKESDGIETVKCL